MDYLFIVIFFLSSTAFLRAQNCGTPGQTCYDDGNCCGGCCLNNICSQSETPCDFRSDPCATYSCPEDTDCIVYHPNNCPGCESYPVCQPMSGQGEY